MISQDQTFSFTEFAKELLQVYQSRVAQDWIEGLIFMSTAGGRVDLLKKVQDRTASFLGLDSPEPGYSGASVEAIIGEFGSGKSHIGYLLKYHFISTAPSTMVIHCQMTGDRSVGEVWARALQNLWISGQQSRVVAGIEMSGYDALRAALSRETPVRAKGLLVEVVRSYLRKVDGAFAEDFATALLSSQSSVMSEFLTAWVARESPLLANEAFQAILGTFARIGVARRTVFILDEVEALESLGRNEQLAAVQAFQDLHDDFAFRVVGLPAISWIFLSTIKFWESAREMLPSFFGERDRTRVISSIPAMEKSEVQALADRYALLLQLAGHLKSPLSADQLQAASEAAWEELVADGRQWHMRSVHSIVRDSVTRQFR